MFKITVDPSFSIIEAQISGFLSLAEVSAYCAQVEPVIARCVRKGAYRMLIDVSGCAIQAQDVISAFQHHVGRVPQATGLAIITGNSIVRMQIRRILAGLRIQIFAGRAEALAWLANLEVLFD